MLQLFQAYSSIFSDGTMVKPYFVDSIVDPYDESKVIYKAEKTAVGNPITSDTAKQVQSIMYRVANDEDGSARFLQKPVQHRLLTVAVMGMHMKQVIQLLYL